jgi:iduronate 2-sulfatase
LFPTLCQLAGVNIPKYLQGSSLVPLLNNNDAKCKSAAFTQFHRKPTETPDGKRYMGYSMITNNYHYIEWRYWDYEHKTAGSIAATELYNLVSDWEENVNISNMPENRELITDLSNRLNKGWRYALPEK